MRVPGAGLGWAGLGCLSFLSIQLLRCTFFLHLLSISLLAYPPFGLFLRVASTDLVVSHLISLSLSLSVCALVDVASTRTFPFIIFPVECISKRVRFFIRQRQWKICASCYDGSLICSGGGNLLELLVR
jgi:hypothetical protein